MDCEEWKRGRSVIQAEEALGELRNGRCVIVQPQKKGQLVTPGTRIFSGSESSKTERDNKV